MLFRSPEWFDGNERGATQQKFVLKNSSPVAQKRRVIGVPKINPEANLALLPMTSREVSLKQQTYPVLIRDDLLAGIEARAFVFDHPYYAITKQDGTFTVPRVPAGSDMQVMAWHESQGWLLTSKGKTMKLKEGKNTLDFEISAK